MDLIPTTFIQVRQSHNKVLICCINYEFFTYKEYNN